MTHITTNPWALGAPLLALPIDPSLSPQGLESGPRPQGASIGAGYAYPVDTATDLTDATIHNPTAYIGA